MPKSIEWTLSVKYDNGETTEHGGTETSVEAATKGMMSAVADVEEDFASYLDEEGEGEGDEQG